MATLGDGTAGFTPQVIDGHKFKVTKVQARVYVTCCGDEIAHYTSSEFGIADTNGWYITQANGGFDGDRFWSLREAKAYLSKNHK